MGILTFECDRCGEEFDTDFVEYHHGEVASEIICDCCWQREKQRVLSEVKYNLRIAMS